MRSSSSTERTLSDALTVARVIGKSSNAALLPGAMIHGRYQVIRELATGSMGTVYLCRHVKLANRMVAVKILSPEMTADVYARERLAEEISSTYDVSHPNVIRTYEYFEASDLSGFSMEYADGGDLLTLSEKCGPLPIKVVLQMVRQICCGVSAIHDAGIVHRDIKPENILLTRSNQIKVSDFGIAYSKARSKNMLSTNVEGAIDYLSPEYVESGAFDERSDIFAIGMVAFRLVAGRTPSESSDIFEALQTRINQEVPPVSAYRPDCPVFLVEFIRKCLHRNPRERFQSMQEMIAALDLVTQTESSTGRPMHAKVTTFKKVSPTPKKEDVHAARPGLLGRVVATTLVSVCMLQLAYVQTPPMRELVAKWLDESAIVIVPAKVPPVVVEPPPAPPPRPAGLAHTVRYKGETLSIIAQWYTGSHDLWREIAAANPGLNVDRIELGQTILIPNELLKEARPLGENEIRKIGASFRTAPTVKAAQRVEQHLTPVEEATDLYVEY